MYFNTMSYEWCHNWLGFQYFCGSPKKAVGRKDMYEERDTTHIYLFIYLFMQVVGLSVRTSTWNNSVPCGRILIKFAI